MQYMQSTLLRAATALYKSHVSEIVMLSVDVASSRGCSSASFRNARFFTPHVDRLAVNRTYGKLSMSSTQGLSKQSSSQWKMSCTYHSSTISAADNREKQGEEGHSDTIQEQAYSDITDKIPVRPVSAPEAVGWSSLILAAYAITAALAYVVFTQLFLEAPEVTAFNVALGKVREDPRIQSMMGESIKGYGGTGTSNRSERHRISHRIYNDSNGVQHVQVQFHIAGGGQRGVVSADMYQENGDWKYAYLYVDVQGHRIVLKQPSFSY